MPIVFPQLSLKPALKTKERTLDPTLRDPMENGMEATQAQWTRLRREWDVTIALVTVADKRLLRDFVTEVTGAVEFLFVDEADPTDPETLTVKFATLPSYTDRDNTRNGKRFDCMFTLREM